MSTSIRRSTVVAAAALVTLGAAGPASAGPTGSAEVRDVPVELSADLSVTEEASLSSLTSGAGVPVAALVDTDDGPQVVRLTSDSRADASAAVRLLEAQPSVDAAAVPSVVRPADTWFSQYGNVMVRSDEARADVDGPLGDVVVAVLDTGVEAHAELRAALLPGRNFTDSPGGLTDSGDLHGHGTHVAGTVAADAGTYVEGVAHGARILPVKVLSDEGWGYSDWVAGGIIWAADHGADVINMSLGSPYGDSLEAAAIDYARSRGVTVVAAAGNSNTSTPHYPAAFAGVIAVSAVDESRQRAWFSNHGSYVDLAAPGVGITSTYPGDTYAGMSGTSMAAPHVAGVAALVEATAPGLTPDQVEQALAAGATDLGTSGRDAYFGHGLVDAVRSVRAANALEGPPVVQPPGAPTGVTAQPLASSVSIGWTAPAATGGAAITGYRVSTYRGTTLVGTTTAAATARSSVVTGLVNGTAYRFAVSAVNPAGTGAPSAQTAAVTPRTVPGAPAIGTAAPGNAAATIRWQAPSSTGGAAITGYQVSAYKGTTLVGTTTAAATARSSVVTGLVNGTAYRFAVSAVNPAGTGAPSAQTAAVTPRTVPGAPAIGTAAAARSSAVVRWTAPAATGGAAVSGYVVRVYTGTTLVKSVSAGSAARSLTVGTLTPGKAYAFRVLARNVAGAGAASGLSNVVKPLG